MSRGLVLRDVHHLVEQARDPAIATDPSGRIACWNRAAVELLEDRDEGVLRRGRSLHEAVEARDVFGNRLSAEATALQKMLEDGEAIQGFEMDVRKGSGVRARVSVSVVAVLGPEPDACHLVHLLRELQRRRRTDELLDRLLAGTEPGGADLRHIGQREESPLPRLTPRERQVLRRLADGLSTEQIAERLHISIHTVRRHFQNLMRKLGIHSKVEAVALALRRRLI